MQHETFQARVLHRAVAFRTRYLHLPYGDQAIFVRTSLFR